MTLFDVSDVTLSYQNQWTDFDNFCIILMINQCYICTMLMKSQNGRKYPCDSFREAGSHICECELGKVVVVHVHTSMSKVNLCYMYGTWWCKLGQLVLSCSEAMSTGYVQC